MIIQKYGVFLKYGYRQIIHFHRIFPYEPFICGYPHGYGNPHGQDEVRLVGLRDVVAVDASAIALQPIQEDVDEDAARMFLGSNPSKH